MAEVPIGRPAAAATQALGIDLILQRIMELSDFEHVKELRLVNSFWNKIASSVLLKSCKTIVLDRHEEINKFDAVLSSPLVCLDLFNKLEMDVTLSMVGDGLSMAQFQQLLVTRFVTAPWCNQMTGLTISELLSFAEINRLTLHLLHHLPCLKELEFHIGHGCRSRAKLKSVLTVPSFDVDAKFELKSIKYSSLGHLEKDAEGIDPTFLLHCPNLQTYAFMDTACFQPEMGGIFLLFFERWKKTVLQKPGFHRIKKLQFLLDKVRTENGCLDFAKSDKVLDAVIEFININKPTHLDMLGDLSYNSIFYPKIGRWEPPIEFLRVQVFNRWNHGDLIVRLLEQSHSFAQLTELQIGIAEVPDDGIRPQFIPRNIDLFKGTEVFQLAKVVTLTVEDESVGPSVASLLQEIASHFHQVTRLNLKLDSNFLICDRGRQENDLKKVLPACKGLLKLSHLSLALGDQMGAIPRLKDLIVGHQVSGGFLENLSTVKNLKTFSVEVTTQRLHPMEVILVVLFYVYEPHVPVEIKVDQSRSSRWIKFTAEQLKQELNKAIRELVK